MSEPKLSPLYLILGEPLLVRARAEEIVSQVFGSARPALNFASYSADEGALGALELAQTVPMMAKKRVVVIRQLESASGALMQELLAYAERPSPSTVLVVTGASLPNAAGAQGPGRKLEALVKKAGIAERISADAVDPVRFLTKLAKERDIALSAGAARTLVGAVGDSLGTLQEELMKLSAFVGPGGKIDEDVVLEVVKPVRETDAFELAAALVRRDVDRALAVTHRLFEADPKAAHAIIGPLTWQVRQLLLLQDCLDRGLNPYDAGVKMRDVGTAKDLLQRHPIQAERMLGKLADGYRALHERKANERDTFEALVISLLQ